MKRLAWIIIIGILAATLIYVLNAGLLTDKAMTESTHSSTPTRPRSADPDPSTSTPPTAAPVDRPVQAWLELPPFDGELFLNGTPVQPDQKLPLPPGRIALTGIHRQGYVLETPQLDPEQVYRARLNPKSQPVPSESLGFRAGPQRAGFFASREPSAWRLKWKSDARGPALSALTLTSSHVLVSTSDRLIQALSRKDGSLTWDVEGAGSSIAPLALHDMVLATTATGQLQAFRLEDGKPRGNASLASYATTLGIWRDATVLITTADGRLLAVDSEPRRLGRLRLPVRWEVQTPPFNHSGSAPLILKDHILFSENTGSLAAYSLSQSGKKLFGKGQPEIDLGDSMRFIPEGDGLDRTPAADGNHVLTVHKSELQCFRASDGHLLWKIQLSAAESPSSNVALAHGLVYLCTRNGHLRAWTASHGTPVLNAPITRTSILAAPSLFRHYALVGDAQGHLLLVHAMSGEVLHRDTALEGDAIRSAPVIDASEILAVRADGKLACWEY